MNAKVTMILLTLGLAVTPPNQASDQNTNPNALYSKESVSAPYPVRIVEPAIPMGHVGERVVMVFEIREDGRPAAVRSKEAYPRAWKLAARLTDVIPGWRFEPARNAEGIPVQVTVELPVRVIPHEKGRGAIGRVQVVNK